MVPYFTGQSTRIARSMMGFDDGDERREVEAPTPEREKKSRFEWWALLSGAASVWGGCQTRKKTGPCRSKLE